MKYVEHFCTTYRATGEPANQLDWIKTLPLSEQVEFSEADKRQKQYREEAVQLGLLIYDDKNSNYYWRDKEAHKINKQADPVWTEYWARWLEAEDIVFTMSYTEIE